MSCSFLKKEKEPVKIELDGGKIILISWLANCIVKDAPRSKYVKVPNSKYKTKKCVVYSIFDEVLQNKSKWITLESYKLSGQDPKKFIQIYEIKNSNNKEDNYIYFSHSHNTNFSAILPVLIDMSNFFKIHILTYDYSQPRIERRVLENCRVVFDYFSKAKTFNKLYVMGVSVGTYANFAIFVPPLNPLLKRITSVIMISPTWVFSSDLLRSSSSLSKSKLLMKYYFDILNTYSILALIVHGKKDSYVKYFLSLGMAKKINNVIEWYPKEGEHLTILDRYRMKLFVKMQLLFSGKTDGLKITTNQNAAPKLRKNSVATDETPVFRENINFDNNNEDVTVDIDGFMNYDTFGETGIITEEGGGNEESNDVDELIKGSFYQKAPSHNDNDEKDMTFANKADPFKEKNEEGNMEDVCCSFAGGNKNGELQENENINMDKDNDNNEEENVGSFG